LLVLFPLFIGLFTFALKEEKLKKILLFLVSLSTGGLFGGAFFHLLPEVSEEIGFESKIALYVLSGIIVFFILEKFIRWRHCHILTSANHPHPFTYLNLIGDGVHNFIDGAIIAGAYLVSPFLGLTTTLAVIFHEIPQEIGDFSVLLYGGFSRKKALIFNFCSALFAIFGCLVILFFSHLISNLALFLVPFAAGGFIYIAGADLIPELHRETSLKKSFFQFFFLLLGLSLMFILK